MNISKWGEGSLTESEVKAIIDVYNKNIDQCSKENEDLRVKV